MRSTLEANRPGQRHDLDPAGASLPKCRCGRIGRCTGCVDVVDEHNAGGDAAMRDEGAADVPAPLVVRQPALARRPPSSRQERLERQAPLSGELACQLLGRVVSTLQPAVRIAWDEDDTSCVRWRHRFPDDCRCPAGEPTQAALLPGDYDLAEPVVVRQHTPSMRKRNSTADALSTAEYRPGRRRATARAERRPDAA